MKYEDFVKQKSVRKPTLSNGIKVALIRHRNATNYDKRLCTYTANFNGCKWEFSVDFVSIFLLDTCVFKVLINTNISCNNNNEEDFVFSRD